MQGEDAFLTLAEFAIALAGFTSIVVVFAHRGGEFSPIDRFRIQNALWTSLGPALIAFAPSALDLFGFTGTALWRASSAIFIVFVVAFFFFGRKRAAALSESDLAVLGGPGPTFLVGSGMLVNLVLQPLNATGVLFQPQAGVLLVGLLFVLVTSITIFVRIVFIRPAPK